MSTPDSETVLAVVDSWDWRHWIGVVLSMGIAAVHLYIGYTYSEQVFFVIGASFLIGVVLYFTRFWHPVLYLLGLVHIGALAVTWVLSGMQFLDWGLLTGVLSAGLGLIALSLFIEESEVVDGS
ncbi:hypothetical protein HWV07_11235 [Natronomonas salina]|uniref:hypothetical protein n=1 Tax=Natronomonas salina TaxID=1710540 RepID=UPI0015B55BC9|nr:hypothetical protein [Natronomonas salina]QLD89574.1 hypothetical protein HWV07_11235 [Natronomonas salina]